MLFAKISERKLDNYYYLEYSDYRRYLYDEVDSPNILINILYVDLGSPFRISN